MLFTMPIASGAREEGRMCQLKIKSCDYFHKAAIEIHNGNKNSHVVIQQKGKTFRRKLKYSFTKLKANATEYQTHM